MIKVEIIGARDFNLKKAAFNRILIDSLLIFNLKNVFVQVSFVPRTEIARLNKDHRGVDKATDVLSFPQITVPSAPIQILGDIVISPEVVAEKDETIEDNLKHGLLHLIGYDHETEPKKWQNAAQKINCRY